MGVSRRRATFATMAGGTANIIIVSIQAVILIPLYLGAVGPRLYGAWLGSGDFLIWMQAFDLGLPNLMIQRIGAAHGQGDAKTVAGYFATGMLVLAIVALIIALIAAMVAQLLPGWMGLSGAEAATLRSCFIVGSVAAALSIFNNSIVGFSRGIQKTGFLNAVAICASLAGFGISLGLVLTGWGLWAIAIGLLTRAVVSLAGSCIFAVVELRGELRPFFTVQRSMLREFAATTPATALGGISYALMNQSEAALVAIFLRPELSVILVLTRKALDVARGFVDMIAFATYGSFAHLVTSDQRYRTLEVHAHINSIRLSAAVVTASAYMAVNASLVSVWVGSAQYGGSLLTILLAVQFIVVGNSFLMNYLYRATGSVLKGSLALLAESAIRLPLMIGLLLWVGLPGVVLAGIITGAVFAVLAYRWTLHQVSSFAPPYHHTFGRVWIVRAMLLSIGVLVCLFVQRESWVFVLMIGAMITLLGSAALVAVDPMLAGLLAPLINSLNRRRNMRPNESG